MNVSCCVGFTNEGMLVVVEHGGLRLTSQRAEVSTSNQR
jgi:hypothetical protein